MRLDLFLLRQKFVDSRNQAQRLIKNRSVRINGVIVQKPSHLVPQNAQVKVDAPLQYVSRGGSKLDAAIAHFQIQVLNRVCIDVGASTGGFTDCLLQKGASRVYAVDVGRNQLAPSLRKDPRVVSMENQDIRTLPPLPESIALLVADLSFISITKCVSSFAQILGTQGEGVVLIKPQFEAGELGYRKHRIHDATLRETLILKCCRIFEDSGLTILNRCTSPLPGAKKGNIEELIHIQPGATK
ncbi:MAG: TlyA family RNA methyltransferase [Myxococcota bacterium]|nr:TlyA family RNA methyltransferase [Myxococcota bacterium]